MRAYGADDPAGLSDFILLHGYLYTDARYETTDQVSFVLTLSVSRTLHPVIEFRLPAQNIKIEGR